MCCTSHGIAAIIRIDYRLLLALLGPLTVQTASAAPDGPVAVIDRLELSLARQAAAKTEPMSECKQADSAQGTAVRGSLKCTAARTAPSALFCMPTCSNTQHMSFALRCTANSAATHLHLLPVALMNHMQQHITEVLSLLQVGGSDTHVLETLSKGRSCFARMHTHGT